MQHECPIHPTSMTKWRNRVGAERLEELLADTIRLAVREKHVSKNDLERVTVDTTVQEKNVTFPTDSKLLHTAIRKLGDAAKGDESEACSIPPATLLMSSRTCDLLWRYDWKGDVHDRLNRRD